MTIKIYDAYVEDHCMTTKDDLKMSLEVQAKDDDHLNLNFCITKVWFGNTNHIISANYTLTGEETDIRAYLKHYLFDDESEIDDAIATKEAYAF